MKTRDLLLWAGLGYAAWLIYQKYTPTQTPVTDGNGTGGNGTAAPEQPTEPTLLDLYPASGYTHMTPEGTEIQSKFATEGVEDSSYYLGS